MKIDATIQSYGQVMRHAICLVLLTFLTLPVIFAQNVTVTGKLTDEDGEPLVSATVQLKGTAIGIVTDIDGDYTLDAPGTGTLIFSYIGYETLEVPIDGRSIINMSLLLSSSQLDEVVVTGYGTARQREITSAITSVSEEDFNKGNVYSTEQLLQGKVAGLAITKSGNDVNQPFFVSLRGVSTLGANSTPLVVIDGVIGGNLELVDPNDIETIDVLKDASAAAIYGTRGSAGVIIITTKSGGGTTGRGVVDYNGYVSISEALNDTRIRPANAQEFLSFGGVDWGGDTNFEEEILRTGVSHVHNLTFSNNFGTTNYRASINYRNVEGNLLDQGFDQLNGRINVSQKLLDDKLSLTAIASYTRRESNYSNPSALRHASTFAPTAPVYIDNDPNKGFFENFVEQNYNPVAMIKLNPHLGRKRSFLGNFKADYKLLEGLTLGANYAVQSTNENQGIYSFSNSRAGAVASHGRADRIATDDINQLFEMTATYKGASGELDYTVLGGYSYQEFDFERFSVTNTDFITDELSFNNLGLGNGFNDPTGVRATSSRKEESLLASFFGRVNLNYKDAYYFMVSYRREGSSRFGSNNRWGDFWAVGGGVDITSLTEISFLDNLKLRVGYGVTGNLPIQNYAYLTTLGAVGAGYVGGAFVPAIQPTSNPNPDLKWEEKGEFNIGIDFALFDFKLSGSLDYFRRNTTDLLNTIAVSSPPNLFSSSLVNLGELESNGLEIQLNYQAINRVKFKWDITLNFTTNETTLVKFNNDEQVALLRGEGVAQNGSFAALIEEGNPIGQIIAPTFAGYSEIGSPLFIDPDGNTTADNQKAELRTVQGNGLPDFTLGLSNSLSYKAFDLSIFLRSAVGHDIANGRRARYEHPSYVGIQNPVITKETTTDDTGLLVWHSKFVEDASYLILDNATLGYTIPFSESSSFRQLRIYFSGQNVFTITSYLGTDPEVRYLDRGRGISRTPGFARNPQYGGDILVAGMDRWELGHMPSRTFTLGVNVGF